MADPHADATRTPERKIYRQGRYALPAGATEILLVRHGESAPFEPGVPHPTRDGQGDPPLAPHGHLQAEHLARRLAGERVDAIYVTPLLRTQETAAPLARATGLTPVVEPDLREVHVGEWEAGLFRQRVRERDPIALQMFERERWDVIPGAESNERLAARVRAAVDRIAAAHPDGRVVAVAHAGVIGTALSIAAGASPFAFVGAENASISVLVVAGGRWSVRRYNDIAHVEHLTGVELLPTS
jgi:2,3-bisphosphoglycerate-dependent phosphoglycerate mutase